jgi:hypothetical protein
MRAVVRTTETSVYEKLTLRHMPEGRHFHTQMAFDFKMGLFM